MDVSKRPISLATILIVLLLGLAGCSDPQSVLAPPDADVTGIQTVLVYSFTNESNQRSLADNVSAKLAQRLGVVGWYDVLAPERTDELLEERRIDKRDASYESTQWHETARDITLAIDADGFILGVVGDYEESVEIDGAYLNSSTEDVQWLVDQSTTVTITVRSKLVNAHTGETVYERSATGVGQISDARQLNWVIPESPPDTVIPAPHRRDLDAALDLAIEDALHQITRDILPRSTDAVDGVTLTLPLQMDL